MKEPEKIGILGVGNLLLADEGFGVHCIEQLQDRYVYPPEIELLDGGTAGIMLAPFMEDKDILLVIDVVDLQDTPGTVHLFSDQDIRAGAPHTRMSPHQVGLLEILDLCRLRDKAPRSVEMFAVVPDDLSTRIGLSPRLAETLDTVVEMIIRRLNELEIYPVPAPLTSGA